MASKTKQTTNQTSVRAPYQPAQPILSQAATDAGSLYQNRQNQQFFPGQTYAGFGADSEAALSGIANRATQGSSLVKEAQSMLEGTAGGQYLSDGNPFSGQVAQATLSQIMPGLNSTFGRAGRTGSDSHAYWLSRGAAEGLAPTNAAAYEAERGRQMQAASLAPTLANQDYMDLSQLRTVGAERDAMAQNAINEQMARYDFDQNRKANALQEYLGYGQAIGGMGGTDNTTGTTTSSVKQSPLQTALGLGLMAASPFTGGTSGMMGGMLGGGLGAMYRPQATLPWNTSSWLTPTQQQQMGYYF